MNRIKYLREEKGMKQEDLAKVLGISIQAVSHYELERRDIPTKTAIDIANFFDVSVDYLLGRTNTREIEITTYEEIAELLGITTKDIGKLNDSQKQQIRDFIQFLIDRSNE